MLGITGYPDGAARRHHPKASLHFAAERPALHEEELPLLVGMRLPLNLSDLHHLCPVGHDRSVDAVRVDPLVAVQSGKHRHGTTLWRIEQIWQDQITFCLSIAMTPFLSRRTVRLKCRDLAGHELERTDYGFADQRTHRGAPSRSASTG